MTKEELRLRCLELAVPKEGGIHSYASLIRKVHFFEEYVMDGEFNLNTLKDEESIQKSEESLQDSRGDKGLAKGKGSYIY